jgi:hypothetical protein
MVMVRVPRPNVKLYKSLRQIFEIVGPAKRTSARPRGLGSDMVMLGFMVGTNPHVPAERPC